MLQKLSSEGDQKPLDSVVTFKDFKQKQFWENQAGLWVSNQFPTFHEILGFPVVSLQEQSCDVSKNPRENIATRETQHVPTSRGTVPLRCIKAVVPSDLRWAKANSRAAEQYFSPWTNLWNLWNPMKPL